METTGYDFGMIGLGVMGRNLLLNMAGHGFRVAGFDVDAAKGARLESQAEPGMTVKGMTQLSDLVTSLSKPRKIMMLVPAGKPVDDVIKSLIPLLEAGDIVIDGGNSHYTDTIRRVRYLKNRRIHFMGMGISGGERGARIGPSIMPGGDETAWESVQPVLEAVSAKVNGDPCVAYMGKVAAGHYVKMVHNGIEYAMMQLICECYDLLHRGGGLSNDELYTAFSQWNGEELQGYLVEITAAIFLQEDELSDQRLVDMILDQAGAKGTGKWTSQDAMDLGIGIPGIDMAVVMRNLSALKSERTAAAEQYHRKVPALDLPGPVLLNEIRDALYFSIIISYAQGLSLLHAASLELKMRIPLPQVVRIWRGGCIIRSALLELFTEVYSVNPGLPNLLQDERVAEILRKREDNLRKVIAMASLAGYPVAGLMSALAYYDSYTTARLPANLLQAQRDYFGAHTYRRTDREGIFHTQWEKKNG